MRGTLSMIVVLFSWWSAAGQEFMIRGVELIPDQVILHYDLIDSTKDRSYNVFVYSSMDNFTAPLKSVSGDVTSVTKLVVTPGANKRIVWNVKEELGATFSGDVQLEVRGRAYIPFVQLNGFDDTKVRKRGVPFIAKWTGGSNSSILNFQLYKDGSAVYAFPNVPNEGEGNFTLPKSIKPGKGYYFRVSDARNSDQVVLTSPFEVKRKIPLALKAIPILVAGGLIILAPKDSGSSNLDSPPSVPPTSN